MTKRNKSKAFWQVKVKFANGPLTETLTVTCADEWTARETCNRANLMPGVISATFESHGYKLFTSWESAMESVAAFCNTDSEMRNAYLSGENPLG